MIGNKLLFWDGLQRGRLPRTLFQKRRPVLLPLACLGLVGLTALANRWSGAELSFSIFYLIPICIAAWWGGFATGILMALASTGLWYVADLATTSYSHPAVPVWNTSVPFA